MPEGARPIGASRIGFEVDVARFDELNHERALEDIEPDEVVPEADRPPLVGLRLRRPSGGIKGAARVEEARGGLARVMHDRTLTVAAWGRELAHVGHERIVRGVGLTPSL